MAQIASAYAVGKHEKAALAVLSKNVAGPVYTQLEAAVRVRGMRPFLHHECIGKGLFSTGFSSGAGTYAAWEGTLTNKEDQSLATRLPMVSLCLRGVPAHRPDVC